MKQENFMTKRLFDLFFSLIAIMFLLPIVIIVAVIIKIQSSGSIFYKGIRTGKHGKLFFMYKFRTMFVGQEKTGGDTTALNDPRITRVGAFLRKYKIDEIPQFINVIKGEMSIVGPRPELPYYTDKYTEEERIILSVKPGITDFSSVELRYLDKLVGTQDVDKVFEEKILPLKNKLRIKYVKVQSFMTDIFIIFNTLLAIGGKYSKK
jgi:lipopolysaccharide/colanic/teichoic acid biosynthesis glycosyltransferase